MPDYINITPDLSGVEPIDGQLFNVYTFYKQRNRSGALWMGFLGEKELVNESDPKDNTIKNNLIMLVKSEHGHLFGLELERGKEGIMTYVDSNDHATDEYKNVFGTRAARIESIHATMIYEHVNKIIQSQEYKHDPIDDQFAHYLNDQIMLLVGEAKNPEYRAEMKFTHKVALTDRLGRKL